MTVVNRTLYPVQNSVRLIGKLQDRFQNLQAQLASGKNASNLAEMGTSRFFDLSIRSRVSRIDGYQSSYDMVNLRTGMASQLVSNLDKLESSSRSLMVPSNYGSANVNFGTVPTLARTNLDQALDLMNTDIEGRYLFSGAKTDVRPVEAGSTILDGAGGKAGFKQVAAERQAADVGNGLGRLTVTTTTDTVALAEDGAHPFGFKLSTVTSSSASVALTQPTGAPPALGVKFNALPIDGDTITIGLTLPDGTSDQVKLKAVTGTPKAGEFQIGVDANATAANFNTALTASLTSLGSTTLVGASNNAAAENFFNGQGQPVLRVQGPSFATATTLVTANPTTTVMWYSGGDSTDPRNSVRAKVDDATTVGYGIQANENGTVNLVRALATMAIQTFTTADPTSNGRFDAIANRNQERLSETHNGEQGSIEMVGVELGSTAAAMKDIADKHTNYKAQLNGMLTRIEGIDDNEVTLEMLAIQTRLQASYQTTSIVSQMSLVNFLK